MSPKNMDEVPGDFQRLAEAVRVARGRKGWTQDELAKAAGVGETTVGNIEGGREWTRMPNTIARIEEALGWEPGYARRVAFEQAPIVPDSSPRVLTSRLLPDLDDLLEADYRRFTPEEEIHYLARTVARVLDREAGAVCAFNDMAERSAQADAQANSRRVELDVVLGMVEEDIRELIRVRMEEFWAAAELARQLTTRKLNAQYAIDLNRRDLERARQDLDDAQRRLRPGSANWPEQAQGDAGDQGDEGV